MDYQYMNANQINTMDYWSLVNMLLTQITTDTRKEILERLIVMNEQLILSSKTQQKIHVDPARNSFLSTRKKDTVEIPNPSLDRINYNGQNPLPLNVPTNANNTNNLNDMSGIGNSNNQYNQNPYLPNNPTMPINNFLNNNNYPNNYSNNSNNNQYNHANLSNQSIQSTQASQPPRQNSLSEIDLDDIINDIHNEPDVLDDKLAKIKMLHTKIISDKRRRRKERENK